MVGKWCVRLVMVAMAGLGGAALVGCGDDSATGPADAVTDALYRSLRDSIMAEFERNELDSAFSDSLFRTVYDSVYNAEVVRIQSQYDSLTKAHNDSLLLVQDSIYEARDSLQALASAAAADSIYHALYGQIYDEIFSNAAAKNITFTSISRISSVSPASYPYLAQTYGADNSVGQLLALTIGNTSSQTYYKIVVEAQIPGFTELATSTQIVNAGSTVRVALSPALLYSAWGNLLDIRKSQVEYKIKVLNNDREVLIHSQSADIDIWPANMFPAFYLLDNGSTPDIYPYHAQWVQPQADSVKSVVESARLLHADEQLVGYQDPGKTGQYAAISRAQVEAVYLALQNRGIGYVNAAEVANSGQVILFPNQVLRHRFANCIDGAGLFASVLERIGIEAEIVFIPGHAFIGYRTWSNSDTWEFVETTLAWNGGTFAQAISQGNSTYNAQLSNINSGVSHVLKISAARSQGYTPYPYDLAF